MKNVLVAISVLFLSGCATIMNNKPEHFSITSKPSSAQVIVRDIKMDKIVLKNNTPFDINLEKKAGYFQGKEYLVKVNKQGYKDMEFQIKPTLSGWYIGNILFGGLIGILIVDPLTGGMWNLIPEKNKNVHTDKQIISIRLLSDLTQEEKSKIKKIK
ncbi:MAG: hypothetical protein CR967_02365 [Proteobacteria bacterium]|nr:MAG: hypothetical protein CR967_02365 [Pseudomonadota bacterium]